jgi:hypothetical protein
VLSVGAYTMGVKLVVGPKHVGGTLLIDKWLFFLS